MSSPEGGGSRRRRVNRGQSIIGFTEAELGLFLALLFFGLNQLGRTGTPVTAARARAAIDSTSRTNPRLQQLMLLARQLDSLDRVMRSAFARDSALASKLSRLQRERDSLSALSLSPVRGEVSNSVQAAQPRPSTPAVASRLTAVEREMAIAQLSRTQTTAALATANQRADSARRQLDAVAPFVSQVIAPTRAAAGEVPKTVVDARVAAAASSGGSADSRAAAAITAALAAGTADGRKAAAAIAAALAAGTTDGRTAAAAIAAAATPRDTMAVLRALAAAQVPPPQNGIPPGQYGSPGSPGSPGFPGSGIGDGVGMGGGSGSPRPSRTVGSGIGIGSGTGSGGAGPGRSRQTPTCIELKVDTGSVAEVLIVGANRYTARGTTGSLDTLLKVMQADIASSKKNRCRHNVRIQTAPQLAVDDYILALNALLPYFNTELARSSGAR